MTNTNLCVFENPLSRMRLLLTPKEEVKPSLRAAINAHCYLCMGGDIEDIRTKTSVTALIKECASDICPLNSVRPYQ